MPSTSSPSHPPSTTVPALTWRPTKIMHMRDLSKDDDFLSHLLVEKLGTGTVPLLVHKMDGSRRLPRTDSMDLMRIVRRVRPVQLWNHAFTHLLFLTRHFAPFICVLAFIQLVSSKGPIHQVMRLAVDELLTYVSGIFIHRRSCHLRPLQHPFCFSLPSIRYYLKSYTQKQINAFAT